MTGRTKKSTDLSQNNTISSPSEKVLDNDIDINESDQNKYNEIPSMRKKEINLVKHTETIDRLVLQNKQLQKDLNDADMEIEDLEKKVEDSSLRISKNLFYIGLVTFLYMVYVINGHLTTTNIKLNEANTILKEYKAEIEKTKLYNDILEKKLGISEKK